MPTVQASETLPADTLSDAYERDRDKARAIKEHDHRRDVIAHLRSIDDGQAARDEKLTAIAASLDRLHVLAEAHARAIEPPAAAVRSPWFTLAGKLLGNQYAFVLIVAIAFTAADRMRSSAGGDTAIQDLAKNQRAIIQLVQANPSPKPAHALPVAAHVHADAGAP